MTFPAHVRPLPDTVVLLHGLWMTPRVWREWVDRYERRGMRVLAPAYPGADVDIETLRANPSLVASMSLGEIYVHLRERIMQLPSRPILMGFGVGGVLAQLLIDAGYGACAVLFNSAPSGDLGPLPKPQAKALFPVVYDPANRHRAVSLTPEEWHFAFCSTLTPEESRAVYDEIHVPGPGRIVWDHVLAPFRPSHREAWVDYDNPDRAPLLFVISTDDTVMPAALQRTNAARYHPATVTEVVEVAGPHLMIAVPGWEQVADLALDWALEHTAPGSLLRDDAVAVPRRGEGA